jgi:hypothetical protein
MIDKVTIQKSAREQILQKAVSAKQEQAVACLFTKSQRSAIDCWLKKEAGRRIYGSRRGRQALSRTRLGSLNRRPPERPKGPFLRSSDVAQEGVAEKRRRSCGMIEPALAMRGLGPDLGVGTSIRLVFKV